MVTGLGLGGAEKVVADLADQMVALGHIVKIVFLKGEIIVSPKNDSIELIGLKFENLNNIFIVSKKYKEVIKKFKPDVVHAHMIHANIFARLNRVGCEIPKLICTAHNSNEGGNLRMLAYKYTNFLSDINTNVSNEASNSLIEKGAFTKENLITVYNGVDLTKFKKIEMLHNNESINFISVGRFNEQKDYPNLLNAIALIKNHLNVNVKFSIIGDGELRSEIETLIQSLGLQKYVQLLGKRSDIPELLNQSDFFILSSKHEGLPTVVIEAMACHTFVISTNCGGSAEIMGDTGKLVPINDSASLGKAIVEALNLEKSEINKNNHKARKRVENKFSLQSSIQAWLKLYEL
ncbi:glycosyltransferase involved in cell wall biosynthesis [Acinetobacter bereziniae]|uniref:glycosyltransferase n=1 Tax=Acinetobacter bereziniae TaxID=106648 RepID=UPI0028599093|nr:glycosyltransferase [Acinetobacter bereziniae]MDR6543218.1 glycosyltransferase involved in cell wall biosynthesis [Acinetobacter bereziniae]